MFLYLRVQGTLFVLEKDVSPKDRLLEALAQRRWDDGLIAELAQAVQVRGCWVAERSMLRACKCMHEEGRGACAAAFLSVC